MPMTHETIHRLQSPPSAHTTLAFRVFPCSEWRGAGEKKKIDKLSIFTHHSTHSDFKKLSIFSPPFGCWGLLKSWCQNFLYQGKTLALKESIGIGPEHSKQNPDQSSKSHYVDNVILMWTWAPDGMFHLALICLLVWSKQTFGVKTGW